MPFRFIHTADVHLDSPLRTLALKNEIMAELVANATRATFIRIINLCIEEQVDALIIAGDLYDGELTSMKTAAFFVNEMQRLVDAGIRAFILRGNHDAKSTITRHISLPDAVHVFSNRGDRVLIKDLGVAIHGLSFAKPHVPESLLSKYKPAEPDMINVGVLHTSLAGSAAHDPYSPCSVEELHAQGYTYWALGHIHKREVHGTHPTTIVMPGIPQGRHINEAGPRSVTLVEIDDHHKVTITERITSGVQFERVEIDLTGVASWDELGTALDQALDAAVGGLQSEQMIVRLNLLGTTALSSVLRRDREELAYEVETRAKAAGPLWVEQIDNNTELVPQNPTVAAELASPVAELRTLVAASLTEDSVIIDETLSMIQGLQRTLPAGDLRERFDPDNEEFRRVLQKSAIEGAAEVLARLESAGEKA